jgi:hypothetical protein
MMEMRAMGGAQAADTPIEPGEEIVRTTVSARWQFIQGNQNVPR